MKTIFITGTAGFIGFYSAKYFLESGYSVIGIDSFSDYYDISLKEARHAILEQFPLYHSYRADITDAKLLDEIFTKYPITHVVHLAAQAGVRNSIINPMPYIKTNLEGFANILEVCRHHPVEHLIYASSSSVYGMNKKLPFSETDPVDNPISLYAATKKSNELMAYSYSHLYDIPTTGLRFFTVYGPYGRPDMAFFLFTKAIYEGKEISIFNNGNMLRDFTYITDIIEGIVSLLPKPPTQNPKASIYNIGNNTSVQLELCIDILEKAIGKKAIKKYLPMQDGDVYQTYADISALQKYVGFMPKTKVEEGLPLFVEWYKSFYKLS